MSSNLVQTPLRVMTYNIRYGTANDGENRWELRRPRNVELIRQQHPEVLGLQEALDFQIDAICEKFPHLRRLGVGREDGKAGGEFSPILYDSRRLLALRSDTFWMSDMPTVPGSSTWGNRNVRICTWAYFRDLKTGGYLWFYNTHIDHESQPSREKSVALLLDRIAHRGTTDPYVVTGDFNADEANPAILAAKSGGLRDSFRLLFPDEKTVGTFNGFQSYGPDKIDYIFVGPQWEVKKAAIVRDKVDGHWPSDHAAVTATIAFPQ